MKRFYLSIILFLTFLSLNVPTHAQVAPCPSATADAFALNPQSGLHNYFGIRITLNQTYPSNVIVTGFIHDLGDANENTPFTLTITTGNLTNETSSTYYETSPTSEGAVTVSSITSMPCFSNPYDYLGQQHNDILDYAYANMSLPAISEDDLFAIIEAYFTTLSIYTVEGVFDSTKAIMHDFEDDEDLYSSFTNKGMSSGFNDYFEDIDNLLTSCTTEADFYLSMRSLESSINASGLSNTEKGILLASSAIYRYSAYYWTTAGRIADWETKAEGSVAFYKSADRQVIYDETGPFFKEHIPNLPNAYFSGWRDIVRADGHGAIQGGVAGIIGGVGGAISSGLLWGAGSSVDNALTQLWHWLF